METPSHSESLSSAGMNPSGPSVSCVANPISTPSSPFSLGITDPSEYRWMVCPVCMPVSTGTMFVCIGKYSSGMCVGIGVMGDIILPLRGMLW